MAILIVVIGSGTATVMIVSAMQANTFNKDNLVALNLAVEGIEAVRSIRDTNWIKFGYDKANCWNMKPEMLAGADCTNLTNLIEADEYTVDLNPNNYSWTMTAKGTALDLAADGLEESNDEYRLVFIDADDDTDTNSNGDNLDDTDLMISRQAVTNASETQTGETRFYRMVTVSYTGLDDDVMLVDSLVQWRTSSMVVHQIRLSSSLTNFNRVKVN